MPALLILLAIGLVIGSWIVSGTIPMLVYYGIKIIEPAYLYPVAFIVPVIFDRLISGFDTEAIAFPVSENVQALFTRGGIYSLKEPLVITLLVFVFVGSIDHINAMPTLVNRFFGFVRSKGALIRAVLISTGITNAMTSNQYATSFIVGDAFRKKFDNAKLPRNLLSRSLEIGQYFYCFSLNLSSKNGFLISSTSFRMRLAKC